MWARSRSAHRAGLSVRAFTAEITIAMAIVIPNSRKKAPLMPEMKDTGTKTAAITSVMEMIAPEISCMASMLACRADW